MKIVIALVFLFSFSFANLNSKYYKKDIKVLKQLDINNKFLKDENLKSIFQKYSKKSHLHYYVKNIKKSSIFVNAIEDILKEEKVPSSLLFMPMAESNFKIKVTSSVNAAGFWQFIPQTAKLFNLRNDKYVDERLDFKKSTKAASKYLKKHYKRFDKWYLSILAYNCGEGRVIEAITRAKIDKYIKKNPSKAKDKNILEYKKVIDDYINTKKGFYKVNKIYKKVSKLDIKLDATDLFKHDKKYERQYLPSESRTYLRKIVAFSMLANRNFYEKTELFKKDNSLATVKVLGGLSIKTIATTMNISTKRLKKLNLHIKKEKLPTYVKYYEINVPKNKVALYKQNISKIKDKSFVVHKVKRGDTLSHLAKKYDIEYKKIKMRNDLKTNKLLVNQEIIIPIRNN